MSKTTTMIYELQVPHLDMIGFASTDATRQNLGSLHLDPRGYVQATDGHRLGRMDGVRWWQPAGVDLWERYPDPILEDERDPKTCKKLGERAKQCSSWTEGPSSDVVQGLLPMPHPGKRGVLIPRTVLQTVKTGMKGKKAVPGATYDELWYIGLARTPGTKDHRRYQAVYFNRNAFAWQSVEWVDDGYEFPDADQVFPNKRTEAASVYLNGGFLGDVAKLVKAHLQPRSNGMRLVIHHDRAELEQGIDAIGPLMVYGHGTTETSDKLNLSAILMPMRAGDDFKRWVPAADVRVKRAAVAQEPSDEADQGDDTPPAIPAAPATFPDAVIQKAIEGMAVIPKWVVEDIIAAYEGRGETGEAGADLETTVGQAKAWLESTKGEAVEEATA